MLKRDLEEGLKMLGDKTENSKSGGGLNRIFEPEDSCPACRWVGGIHRILCAPFLEFLDDPEYLELYKAGPGVCMRHFRYVLETAEYSHVTLSSLEKLFLLQNEDIVKLMELCSEYIRKNSWGARREPGGAEEGVKDSILTKIAGLQGFRLE